MIRRDWSAAREKLAAEGFRCRVCRGTRRVEMAHVIGREADLYSPLYIGRTAPQLWEEPYLVVPARVVPLCGPSTDVTTCHGRQHAGRLELIPFLTLPEVLQAVADASKVIGGNGFENARLRLVPLAERGVAA